MKRLIFLFVLTRFYVSVVSINLRHIRALSSRCDDSLKNVRDGVPCPASQTEWDERSKEMKCENFTQNCTEKNNFVYHCLVNPWRNNTVEVCAPVILIPGQFCAEFNKGGARVQTQYWPCESCPILYNSSESYKYRECYELQTAPEMSTKQQISERESIKNRTDSQGGENHFSNTTTIEDEDGRGSQHVISIAAFFIVIPVVILILVIPFVFNVIRQRGGNKPDTNDDCLVLCFARNQDHKYRKTRSK